MSGTWFASESGGSGLWALSETDAAASAPTSVSADSTGGTTALISWVAGGGGVASGFDVQLESPAGSSNWVAAAGAANPTGSGVATFAATGLTVATSYTPRVRAKRSGFSDSAWTTGLAFITDNSGVGGGVIGAGDTTAPTLTGSIAITALTSTSYTATCAAGSDAVGVTGYQWRLGGSGSWTDIAAGGRAFNFTGRTPASIDALEMRCRDAAGNFSAPLSTSVTLLGIAPAVTTQPNNSSVVEGATATLTAAFSGTPTPALQWFRNGAPVSGATSGTYAFAATLGDNGAVFVCVATNSAGTISSNAAVLTVTAVAAAPTIVTQPASQTIAAGEVVTFSAVAAGTSPLAYQWLRNGAPISGATSDSYSFVTALSDTGAAFSVQVTNGIGSATSNAAALTVTSVGSGVALASLEKWLPFVLPDAPGCPADTAVHHIRQAAIEFFERTHAWSQELPVVLTVLGENEYPLTLPAGAASVKLFAFSVDGVDARTIDREVGRRNLTWNRDNPAAWLVDRATAAVNPAPAAAGQALRFTVSLRPTQNSLDVPDDMFEHYADEIAKGALARLLKIRGQAWTDMALSTTKQAEFEAHINAVQWRVQKGFARSAQRTVSVWF